MPVSIMKHRQRDKLDVVYVGVVYNIGGDRRCLYIVFQNILQTDGRSNVLAGLRVAVHG